MASPYLAPANFANSPTDGEIAVELRVKVAHDAAPGQGRAKVRSRSRSTLA
jgi:hypothetical protein